MHKQHKFFLFMISFFIIATEMFGPIYAIFVKDIGGDVLAAGAAWSIYLIISGIGLFFMGKLEDRIQKDKLFMLVGYSITSLSFLGYFFVSSIIQLFLVQVLLGVGTMIVIPARDSFYTKYLEKGKFASQWANWESTWFIGAGIGALAGGFFAKIYGFRVLFLIMFVLSLIGLVIVTQLEG